MAEAHAIMKVSPPQLTREGVLDKCDYFVDVQVWPLANELRTRPWLHNFTDDELPYALRLLDSFLFLSKPLVDSMFVAGFQALSAHLVAPGSMPLAVQSAWRQFFRDVIITHVEGEEPSTTDSGYAFARRARQLLELPHGSIFGADEALGRWSAEPQRPLVFVDDFIGSGHQFEHTWIRQRSGMEGSSSSFAEVQARSGARAFYCPLLATSSGLEHLERYCSGVRVLPVHKVDEKRDSVLGEQSLFWSAEEREDAVAVIRTASLRAGIPENGSGRWDGYEGLALAVAFDHSVPDATMPIFYWEENGWQPLIRRR